MEFCPNCGKLLRPKEEKDEVFLACPSCGYKKGGEKAEGYVTIEEAPKEKVEEVAEVIAVSEIPIKKEETSVPIKIMEKQYPKHIRTTQ